MLFVDCVGNEPLRVYGVPLENEQSNAALKDHVAKAALPNQVIAHPHSHLHLLGQARQQCDVPVLLTGWLLSDCLVD